MVRDCIEVVYIIFIVFILYLLWLEWPLRETSIAELHQLLLLRLWLLLLLVYCDPLFYVQSLNWKVYQVFDLLQTLILEVKPLQVNLLNSISIRICTKHIYYCTTRILGVLYRRVLILYCWLTLHLSHSSSTFS